MKKMAFSLAVALLAGCGSSGSSGGFDELGAGSIVIGPTSNPAPQGGAAPRAFNDVVLLEEGETVETSLLANDTAEGARVTAFTQGSQGGQVSLSREGLLTYTPPSASGSFRETFTYTLQNEAGTSTAQVTAKRESNLYVDSRNQKSNPNGTKANPYPTLGQAVAAAGGQPYTIFVAPGEYSNEPANITLAEGQSVVGQNGETPIFHTPFNVPTLECILQDLNLVSAGTGAMIRARGNQIPTRGQVQLVLKNLLVQNGDTGISLQGAVSAELTNILGLNLRQGVVLTNPLGGVKLTSPQLVECSQAGITLVNDQTEPVSSTVEIDRYQPQRTRNPIQVTASAGQGQLLVNQFACKTSDLSGTVLGGVVSGSARFSATVTAFDLRNLGDVKVFDWQYADSSTGTVRIQNATQSLVESNRGALSFRTRQTADGTLVLQKVPTNLVNPVTVESFDTSKLRLNVENYSTETDDQTVVAQGLPYNYYAHDRSNFYLRMQAQPFNPKLIPPRLVLDVDASAVYNVVQLALLDINNLRPIATYWGFTPTGKISVNSAEAILQQLTQNYKDLESNSPEVPQS